MCMRASACSGFNGKALVNFYCLILTLRKLFCSTHLDLYNAFVTVYEPCLNRFIICQKDKVSFCKILRFYF